VTDARDSSGKAEPSRSARRRRPSAGTERTADLRTSWSVPPPVVGAALSSLVVARWIIALVLSSVIVLRGVPRLRTRAFRTGWFERGTDTRRARSQRRPTHGGLVLAVAMAAGALVAGPGQPAARAVVAAAVLTVASCFQAEAGRGASWRVPAGRLAVAVAVPLAGVRAEVTGSVVVDTVFTALAVAALSTGLRSVERSDGTVPMLVAIAATPLLAVADRAGEPVAPVAAAVLGASLALAAHAWPPAAVRIGTMGPTILGAALAAVAIELDPGIPAPRALAVPVLALATIGIAILVPDWDLRLRRRRIPCHLLVPLVAMPGAWASYRLATGAKDLGSAVAMALIPPGLLALIGLLTPRPGAEDRVSHRGRNLAIAGTVVLFLAVAGAAGARSLWSAREDMQRGREFATSGLDAARDGDLEEAQQLFETADAAFADAQELLANPAVRLGDVVPGVAQNLRHARTLADVGGDLSSTAVAVAERAGADDLQVVDGQFPINAAREVSAELGPALATLREAAARLDRIEPTFLVPEVRDGVDAVAERIADATDSIEVAAEATRLAPALLGADGDRRWIVAVLTPSEERGAGGLAGDYAELRATDGDVELVRSLPARDLNAATDRTAQLAAVPDVYRERYEGFRVGRFWQNLSATPDVPTFGQAIASAYPLLEDGGPVDGVVVVDPEAIAALLELTGPVLVAPWPVPLTSDNIAKVLQYGHYAHLSEEQIDAFQGDVIEEVVDALTTGSLPSIAEMAAILGPEVVGGHLRLWSPEPDPQALFARVGADGGLGPRERGTDFVQLVTQNDGENKIDWYLQRSITYEATIEPESGTLAATATVTLTNDAPDRGVSSYVIGEEGGPTKPGENELELTLFSPHRLLRVTDANGNILPVNLGREQGLNAVTVVLEIPSGESATVVFTYRGVLPPTNGAYSLTLAHQTSVNADHIVVHVTGAPGWRLPGGGTADLETDADGAAHLDVAFRR